MPLELTAEEFRQLAGEVVRLCAEYLESLDGRPAYPQTSGAETARVFGKPWPDAGLGRRAFDELAAVLEHSRPPSPRFCGYVFGSGEPVGALADLLASVVNQNVTAWRSAPAAVAIERTVVGWIADAVGCGGFGGSLCGGGSSANLMALAMAREAKLAANERGAQAAVVYASEEVHMSIPKAVALLGLGRANLRLIPTDEQFRMIPRELERAVEEDRRAGKKAVAIVASAGTVNTGAIDPLEEIAAIARRHGLWLHVDGAYGALAAMAVPEKFPGLAMADSLSLDPHKWLYQPADVGCLLFRDATAAHAAFAHTGDYAKVLNQDPLEGFAFFEESMELSRRFRALKLWLSLRYHGREAFREAIRADLAHARQLAARIAAEPKLELLAPVELSAVCFRVKSEDESNRFNAQVLKRVIERRRVFFSNATIRGKFALRACFVNHRTADADVEAVMDEVLAAADALRG
jgi:glutamate/tyrosine decarboxylase-like PLP-dependent enzyme